MYMSNIFGIHDQFGGHFVYGTYLAITCEVDDVVGCVLVYIYAEMLGLYAHLAC